MRFNASRKLSFSPSTKRVHDLDVVAIVDFTLCVFTFWHDLAVDLHGDTALRVTGFREQVAQRAAGSAGAGLPIQDDRDHVASLVVSAVAAKFQHRKKQRPDMPGADIESNNG